MKEKYLLSGNLEPTNEPYSIAKIAGIKMCESYNRQYGTCFISAMPTNLYGPGDNFDLETSHALPALIRKFHEGKISDKLRGKSDESMRTVTVWGSGLPRREFLHVDDLADACLFIMNHHDKIEIINIGAGKDISIKELAEMIKDIVGFKGDIRFDLSRPDGMPRKLLDIGKLEFLGWRASIPIREGIEKTYKWYVESLSDK